MEGNNGVGMDYKGKTISNSVERRSSSREILQQSRALAGVSFPNRLLDAVPTIFMLLNENRQVVFANNTVMDLLGIESKGDIYGLRPGEALRCVYTKENADGCGTSDFCSQCGANAVIRASLSGEEGVREFSLLRKNEKEEAEALDMLVWGTPFEFEGKRYSAFSVMDVSHEKRRRSLERIFFHDILNIAGGIQTYTEILAYKGKPIGMKELDVIHTYIKKLVDEIQTQRELAKAENSELTLIVSEFNSREFLEDTLSMYREHETARDRILALDPDSENISLTSDLALLGRVLGNMIKNACEASRPGETVTAGCTANDDGVEFRMHNNGFIPPDIRKQIFKRSFSTKSRDRGLGTYSMKLLGERYLGGKVGFTSTEEQGTTFRIWLPRKREE
ncbi:MAG: PAS domain-containing sensor histidine kinase [Candidatus Latescibacterota bacterium]